VLVAIVMALARTPPDVAISSLSQWAEWAGVHRIPLWLRNPKADEVTFRWGKRLLIVSTAIMATSAAVYYLISPSPRPIALPVTSSKISELPSIPRTDTPVYGWLKPANHPTPPNGCDGKVPDNATKILIGTNAAFIIGLGKIIVLRINECEALSVERTESGVLLSANINDGSGLQPASIVNNRIVAQNGETYSVRQSSDESLLTVRNNKSETLLEANFLNKSTIQIVGSFGCVGDPVIRVTKSGPIPTVTFTDACFGGRGAFSIQSRPPSPPKP
jgi:hypothetical protein